MANWMHCPLSLKVKNYSCEGAEMEITKKKKLVMEVEIYLWPAKTVLELEVHITIRGIFFHIQYEAAKTIRGVIYQHLDFRTGCVFILFNDFFPSVLISVWTGGQQWPMKSLLELRIMKSGDQVKLSLCWRRVHNLSLFHFPYFFSGA